MGGRMDGWMDGWTDGWTDGRMDGRTADGRTDGRNAILNFSTSEGDCVLSQDCVNPSWVHAMASDLSKINSCCSALEEDTSLMVLLYLKQMVIVLLALAR